MNSTPDTSSPSDGVVRDDEQIIAFAARLSAERGQVFTPIRQHVLKTLLESSCPLTAYDVLERLGGIGANNPPTAYRALDFLEDLGLIRKITSLRKYVVLRSGPTLGPVVFSICEACGKVREIEDSASLLTLAAQAKLSGFVTRHITVELRGICEADILAAQSRDQT